MRPGRQDVTLPKNLQHRGAHEASEISDPIEADGESGQYEMSKLVDDITGISGANGGQQVKSDREEEHEIDGYHKGRHRYCTDRQHANEIVDPAVAMER